MAIQAVAEVISERVLVVGSLPPEGRDLDLLVRPVAEHQIRCGLIDRGWIARGNRCALLQDCSAQVVELLPAHDVGLPEPELTALFAQGVPLIESSVICRPAPHHALLILARRFVRGDGRLGTKHGRQITRHLETDLSAWETAAIQAPAWGAEASLAGLRAAYESRTRMSRASRAAAVADEITCRGGSQLTARIKGWHSAVRLPRRRRSFIVALSGLDGAGKSTQAAALREALLRLGFDAEVRWTSLANAPRVLGLLRRTADRLLIVAEWSDKQGGSTAPAGTGNRPAAAYARPADTRAKRLRRRSPVVAFGWTSLVAFSNGVAHMRATRPHLTRGRVIICDRYILDSKVQLRYDYGESGRFAFQMALIRLLSPQPDRAFLLQVSPQTASERKADYELSQNIRRARLYAEESAQLDVQNLDAERARSEVCAELAADVWSALSQRTARRRRVRPRLGLSPAA